MSSPPSGWYPDPDGSGNLRWWDGSQWTDDVVSPNLKPTLRSWLDTSVAARTITTVVAVLAGLATLTAGVIVVAALWRQRPLDGIGWLVVPAVPLVFAGQVWAIVVLYGWTPPGSIRGRVTMAMLRPVFTVMPKIVGYGLLVVFFLGWLSAVTAFPGLSSGGPSTPTQGCPNPLFDHGVLNCVSRSTYLHSGADGQRFAAGILMAFFSVHFLVALAEGVRQRHPEVRS